MNDPSDRERLLADVLAEAEPPDFRATLLNETLRLARRRRRIRQVQRASVLLVALGVLTGFVWRVSGSFFRPAPSPTYELVHTHALPASAQVASRPFEQARVVESFPSVVVVETPPGAGWVRWIDDRELLALAAPRPAALIRIGPQSQQLIFPDGPAQDSSP